MMLRPFDFITQSLYDVLQGYHKTRKLSIAARKIRHL